MYLSLFSWLPIFLGTSGVRFLICEKQNKISSYSPGDRGVGYSFKDNCSNSVAFLDGVKEKSVQKKWSQSIFTQKGTLRPCAILSNYTSNCSLQKHRHELPVKRSCMLGHEAVHVKCKFILQFI